MPEYSSSRRIAILREDVSRKIAAGEVIDRPFSVVRELLDNSIDAGSKEIDLFIDDGGATRIRIADDGEGMSEQDLGLCCQRHATSKIRSDDDLDRVTSLGFRGEALAAIAACARLEIVSMQEAGIPHRLLMAGGQLISLSAGQGKKGTVIEVSDLFFNMPVRKKFLKSANAETSRCRQTFLDKVLPHPDISFRFTVNGKLKHFFPAQVLKERISYAFGIEKEQFTLIKHKGEGFHLTIAAGRPELNRRDKKMIRIFVNRRRIYEYSLIHAVEYAYSEYMPGGIFPVAFVFLEIDPQNVDFNIHPAKKEVRFQNIHPLHRCVVQTLKSFLTGFNIRTGIEPEPIIQSRPLLPDLAKYRIRESERIYTPAGNFPSSHEDDLPFKYCGQVFKLFLLVECGESLYIVDQHAAHERVLYDRLKAKEQEVQEMLMPIRFEVTYDESCLVEERKDLFKKMGMRLEKIDSGSYEIASLPVDFLSLEEEELIKAILTPIGSVEDLESEILRLIACRTAIKEGEEIDPSTAIELIRETLRLKNARCPHGRPLWYHIPKSELFRHVGR